jgi:hypothetical protein
VKEELLGLRVVGLFERSEFNQNSWHSSFSEPSTSLCSYLAYGTYLFIIALIFSIYCLRHSQINNRPNMLRTFGLLFIFICLRTHLNKSTHKI